MSDRLLIMFLVSAYMVKYQKLLINANPGYNPPIPPPSVIHMIMDITGGWQQSLLCSLFHARSSLGNSNLHNVAR